MPMEMPAYRYRATLDDLGLSQVGLARLLDVEDITARRWAAKGITGPTAILLTLLAKGRIKVKDIQRVHPPRDGYLTLDEASEGRVKTRLKSLKGRKKRASLVAR